MKRATGRYNSTVDICAISIHALVKRATGYLAGALSKVSNFNPRPREEGDLTEKSRSYPPSNFNPRPREEGDPRGHRRTAPVRSISIHALVKRATEIRCVHRTFKQISIHALVKRATHTHHNKVHS